MTDKFERYVPLFCWMIAVVVLILIPFKILGYGYLPGGDVRRHVAQSISQRPYTEVVVMRPEYVMDHSPGWDWVLRTLHQKLGWKADTLSGFSIAGLMVALFFAPLAWLRRPEAWLAALLAMTIAIPEVLTRWSQARPYIFTEAVLVAVLLAWSKSRTPSRWTLAWTSAGIALSVWIHGAWYLWALPVAAFALAGWWRAGLKFAGCCVAGVAMGGILTGRPIAFLNQAWQIVSAVSHEGIPKWMMVGEFQPSYGEAVTLVMLAIVFFWRRQQNRTAAELVAQPAFCMIVIGWILGLYADRFWADWGVPAVMVWLTLQFEDGITGVVESATLKRAVISGLLALPLFWHCTNDLDRRYTRCLDEVHLDVNNPALQGWMPEGKGIFYSADMGFFYNTYYDYPEAAWRYVLGFEPALMLDDDLKIFRTIQWNRFAPKSFEPWVAKMQPCDRLAIYSASEPELKGAEWKYAGGTLWIGRKTR